MPEPTQRDRVALSYAVIAWLLLQIGDVVLDPFDIGEAAMRVLLVVVALGFPVALALAWFFELTPHGVERDTRLPGAPRPRVIGIRRYADIVIIGVLVLAVAFLLARQGGLIEEAPGEQVVAVLPFENMGPEAADAYFGEGLADTVIHKLGQLGELVVLASQSTFQFRGRDLDLVDVGGKLGATVIMLGSVQRAGNALRVNARLVEVPSGRQLWSGSYDRGLQDVFAIQDEIAASVTEALHLVLAPETRERLAAPPTSSLTAYEAYVLGVDRLAKRTGKNLDRAIGYFRQATVTDPAYALAHAGLSEALYIASGRPFLGEETVRGIVAEAGEAARRAMELDSELGEAWLARALAAIMERRLLGRNDLQDSDIVALFEKSIALGPNSAMAHKYFANFYADTIDPLAQRVEDLLLAASRLDPRSGIVKLNLGNLYARKSETEAAEFMFRESALTQEPFFTLGIRTLIDYHCTTTGRLDEAARWARVSAERTPDDSNAHFMHFVALAHLGAWDEARAEHARFAGARRQSDDAGFDSLRWTELSEGILLARAEGDLDRAYGLANSMLSEFLENSSDWPVLQRAGWHGPSMTTLALWEIREGRAADALARFRAGYPGPFEEIDTMAQDLLNPVAMQAALMKHAGEHEQAERLLKDYLAHLQGRNRFWLGQHGGYSEFVVYALLGETGQAVEALERAIDEGYFFFWWMLRDGAFDPDYAAVIADPRFEAVYARIVRRVGELREEFLAQPEPAEGQLR
jgi:TolB-like protein